MTKRRHDVGAPTIDGPVLLEEEGLKVGERVLLVPNGEYPLDGVLAVEQTLSRPVLVPVLLALLGTLNLAFAMQTGHLDIFVAAGLMLGCGLWFWLKGTRHVMTLTTQKGDEPVWYSRDQKACKRACELVRERVAALRGPVSTR